MFLNKVVYRRMNKHVFLSGFLIALAIFLGYFTYSSEKPDSRFSDSAFQLGLDLAGGTELIYTADLSLIDEAEIDGAMSALRDVVERRVNIFGVSEPIVQTEQAGLLTGNKDHRLIVELPGVTDVEEAVRRLGQTPLLEFKIFIGDESAIDNTTDVTDPAVFADTGLTGRLLKRATLNFASPAHGGAVGNEPIVTIDFNQEGQELFAQLTRENVGQVLGIFLDGVPISLPVIREEITHGSAQISGGFAPEEARDLVRDLNFGALPVPIELVSTQTVGASLGQNALLSSATAGFWGLLLIIIFLILWYRLPGVIASLALVVYILISLSLFKVIPVTLTAAGLAGFVVSIGIAIDANILIFERIKEELRDGNALDTSITEGFKRAWASIRDSNISSIITAIVLFWLGTSSVKGFALTFGIGVLVSMITAITVSRTFLQAVAPMAEKGKKFLFGTGFGK